MNNYMLEADTVGSQPEAAMNSTRYRPKSYDGTGGQSRSFDESSIASTPGSISLQSQGLLKFNGGKSITSTSTSTSAGTMLAATSSNQENGMSVKYDVMYQALHGLLTGEPDSTDIERNIGSSQTDSWDGDDGKQEALHFDAGIHDRDKYAVETAANNRYSSRRAPENLVPSIKKRKQKQVAIDYSQRFRPNKRLQTNKDAKCSPAGASVEKSSVTSCQQEVVCSTGTQGTQRRPYEAKATKMSSDRTDESSEEELNSFVTARENSPLPAPKTFEDRLEGIKEYKRIYGHCNIPESYGSESDPTLGKWCTDVRSTYTAFESRSILPKRLVPIRKSLDVQKLRSLRNAGFQLSAGVKRNAVYKRSSRPPPSLAEVMLASKDYPCLSTAAAASTGRPGKTSTSTKTNRNLPFDDGMKEPLSFKGQNGNFGGPSYCENIQQSGTDQYLSHRCSASRIEYDEYSKGPPPPLGQMEERLRHLQDAGFPLDEIMAMKEAQTRKLAQFTNEANYKASSDRTQQAQNVNFYNARAGAGHEHQFVATRAQHESDGFVKDSTGRRIPALSPAPMRTAMQVTPPGEETFSVLATNHDANSYCSTLSPVSNSTPLERLALQRPNEKEAPMRMVAGTGVGYNMPLPTNQNLQSSNSTAQSNAIASAICRNSSHTLQTQLNHSSFAQSNEMKLREKSSVDPALAQLCNDIRSSFTTFQSTTGIPTGLTETRVKCLEDAVMQLFSGVQEQGSNQTNKILPLQTMPTARPLPKAKTFDECVIDLLIFKGKFGHCNVPFDYLDEPHLGIWVNDIRLAFKELQKLPGLPETVIATRFKRLQDIGFIFDFCEYAHNKDAKKKPLSAMNVSEGVNHQTPRPSEEVAHNAPTFPRVESNTASKVSAAAIRDANILLQSATKMRNVAVNNSSKINDRFISTPPLIYKEPLNDAKKVRSECGAVDTCAKTSEVFIPPLNGCEIRLNCTKQKPVDEPAKASGSSSTRSSRTFEEYLNDIHIFKSKYGHCDIPENYSENPSLGRWCQDLKSKYEAFQKGTKGLHEGLSFSRIKSLEDAGFQLSAESNTVNPTKVTDTSVATLPVKEKSDTLSSTTSGKREYKTFDQRIDDLIEFKKKNGHCNVPYAHKKDPSLGSWCCDIRSAYKAMKKGKARRNALTESKIKRLEEIQFKFHLDKRATRTKKPPKPKVGTATLTTRGTLRKRRIKRSFDQRVEDLKDFKKIHGHCNVPYSHAPDPSLGTWCSEMRKGYKVIKADSEGRRNGLNADKIKRLEDIGFQWCIRAVKDFEERVKELLIHKDKWGHCNVSKKENPSLYEWCHNKRVGYVAFLKGSGRCHALTENRVKRLKEIGFNWMISQTVSRATTQSKSKTSIDHILCMKQTKSKLFEDLITANSKAFEEKIDDLNALKSKFGHCNVPKGYSNDPVLDKWCMDIRSGYRIVMKDTNGPDDVLDGLASQRIQRLKDIGFRLTV